MSSITYRYEQNYSFVKKGIKHTIKESVIDGSKGLSLVFLEKKGEDFYKMYAKETEKDKFEVDAFAEMIVAEGKVSPKFNVTTSFGGTQPPRTKKYFGAAGTV